MALEEARGVNSLVAGGIDCGETPDMGAECQMWVSWKSRKCS